MAKFIPNAKPDTFNNSYGERKVYEALRILGDEYTIFYSLDWVGAGGKQTLGEADFVILHPEYGILVIEVKSGGIEYKNGSWIQTNTKSGISKMIRPYNQARRSQFEIMERLDDGLQGSPRPMLGYAVWFPSVDLEGTPGLPLEAAPEITLDKNALLAPETSIVGAFAYWAKKFGTIPLNEPQLQKVIAILCPYFHAIPSLKMKVEEAHQSYIRLTRQQMLLLDFLEEQPTAAIHGPAGTGKTVLAVEKAKRLAAQGHNVLLLCYNSFLRSFLKKNNSTPSVDFHTAHSLAYNFLGHKEGSIDNLLSEFETYLTTCGSTMDWKYDSVIVDEGQDLNDALLCRLFELTEAKGGSFYVFYDRNQNVLSQSNCQWIESMECRLVLHNNCRNTKEIFEVSCNMIGMTNRSANEVHGDIPTLQFYSTEQDEESIVDAFLDKARTEGLSADEIVVLTAKTVESSPITLNRTHGGYSLSPDGETGKVLFTTIRKFKGLEAEAVLIVDSSMSALLNEEHRKLLYVGASRARTVLSIALLEDVPAGEMGTYMRNLSPGRMMPRNKKGVKRLLGTN